MTKKILIVDDEEVLAETLREILQDVYKVEAKIIFNGIEALSELESNYYDCVISDENMPSLKGTELFKKLKKDQYGSFVLMTGGDVSTGKSTLEGKSITYITKPFKINELDKIINS